MLTKLTRIFVFMLLATVSTKSFAHSVVCGVNNNTQCLSGNSFAFTATPDLVNLNPTFDWDFGDGTAHSTLQNPTHTYATNGSYTATCVCTWTSDGYVASCTKSVTVYSMPSTPTISAGSSTTFCTGGSVVLTSSSATGNQWYKNGVAISGATNQTYTATTSGSYTVVVTNANGCSSTSAATTVTVNSIPSTPTISGSPTTFCSGGSVVLTSSSASGNQWYKNGVAISGATNQTYTATTSGTYTVVVTTSGCSSAASAGTVVTVNSNPSTPTISASGSTNICSGSSVTLTSSSATGNQWYKDGVAISGATNQTLTVTVAGSYTVTVTNGSGCSATSAAAVVTVKSNSTSTTNASICSGSSYTFNGTSYSVAGTYVAHLTSANGCDSAATLNLTVNANPGIPSISGTASFCVGGSTVLTSSSATGNQWYKDGVAISGATNQTLTVTVAGSYTVTVTNGSGCSATSAAAVVTVKSNSTSTTNASICSGSSYTFNGTSYSVAGTYVAHLTSANGCDSAATLNLTVNANPGTPSATVTCGGGAGTGIITVNSPSGAGITYSLDGGAYQSSNTFSSVADGSHTITAKNSSNCISSTSVSVSCTPVCTKPNAGSNATVCGGNCMNISGTSPATGTWTAQAGNPAGATLGSTNAGVAQVCFNSSASGSYNFIYTVSGGCTDTMTIVANTPATVGNYVWTDLDSNGIQNEPASSGINGVVVELYKDNGTGTFVLVTSTTTANDGSGNPGYYNFNICTDGDYKVKFPTNVGGGSLTTQTPTAGTDGNSDANTSTGFSPSFTINTTGVGIVKNNPTIDAGYLPSGVTPPTGLESKTLGDVIAVRLFGNAINNLPQENEFTNKNKFTTSGTVVNGINDLTLATLTPTSVSGTDVAYTSTPADLMSFTNAIDVLAVNYNTGNIVKAVAFGTKTLGDVYTHTKPICDRLKGAELMEVKTINVNGYSLMAYKVRQRTGETEFAMNLSAGTAANRNSISLQSNWFTDSYVQDEKLYNFQLWAVSYDMVKAMAQDIVNRLQANGTVNAVTTTDLPKAYISNGSRTNTNLNVTIQNNTAATTGYFELKEKANENSAVTTRQIAFNLNANNVSNVTIPVKDNYEGNIYVYVNNTLTDLVYLADGTWSLDYNKATTSISKFNVTNEATIASNNNELRLMRNVSVTGTSKDYISIYKTMLGGGLEQNVSDYKSIIFNANAIGASSVKVTLIKKSITTYSEQYTYTQSLDGDKEYAINLNQFKSTKGNTAFDASDITAVSFSFNNSRGVATTMTADLSKVRFSKAVAATVTDNNLSAISIYPNPATTRFTANFNSDKAQSLVLKVTELATGRVIKTQFVNATKGLNKQSIELSNSTASGNYIVTLEGDDVKYNATKVMVGK